MSVFAPTLCPASFPGPRRSWCDPPSSSNTQLLLAPQSKARPNVHLNLATLRRWISCDPGRHLQLVPKLRTFGAIPLLSPYAFRGPQRYKFRLYHYSLSHRLLAKEISEDLWIINFQWNEQTHSFPNLFLYKLYMFRVVPPPIIRS
jgi:hypothetical protein